VEFEHCEGIPVQIDSDGIYRAKGPFSPGYTATHTVCRFALGYRREKQLEARSHTVEGVARIVPTPGRDLPAPSGLVLVLPCICNFKFNSIN
jgi:hypothetical protein